MDLLFPGGSGLFQLPPHACRRRWTEGPWRSSPPATLRGHKSSQAHVERGRPPIPTLFGAIFNFQAHVILHTLSSDFDPSSSCDSGSGAAWGHRAPALSKLFHSIIPAFAQYKYHLGA